MPYEVKSDELTDDKYNEMQNITRDNICSVCGKELTVHTNPAAGSLEVGCIDRSHTGWRQRTTAVQEYRRGGAPESSQVNLARMMNLLAIRYHTAIVDKPTAALFIGDCMRLGLDPLMQPAEAIPIPFTRGKDGKKIIQMIISIDGWLSMAARGCPEAWAGAPTIEPVFNDKLAESLSGDPKAWVYRATGCIRLTGNFDAMSAPSSAYGYYTQAEFKRAQQKELPAGKNPGNQAAVRAVKRWVRQNFPQCRQRMIELSAEWHRRAEGIEELEEYIDAEYTILDEKEPGEKGVKGTPKSPKSPKTTGKKASEAEIKCGAKQEGTGEVTEQETGEADAPDFSETETSSKKSEASAADIVGDGFNIDLQWLKDALSDLKWNDNTCKTFLVSQYKVSPQGTLEDVIKRLTREQAEDFVKQINKKLEKQSSLF